MDKNILLSVCIPTYNRSGFLRTTILSIVNQERFINTSDVEIIIADNCSTDDTGQVAIEFVQKYGDKIRYFRNEENIGDGNFAKSLSHGNGLFLKLNNDTLKHFDGSLDIILSAIDENRETRNILFFSNGALLSLKTALCENLDSFIETASFYSTWIGAFGIWKTDFDKLPDFNRRSDLHLTQVDVLYRLINTNKAVYIDNSKICDSVQPAKRGGYDILGVFMDNYFFLLTEQFENKRITGRVYENEKKKVLYKFIRPWLVQHKLFPESYILHDKNSFERIFNYFSLPTFSYFFVYYNLSLTFNIVKRFLGINVSTNSTVKS
jgi:abequosyltransferase